ncbi:MAG: type II toxin-antitoxin system RatA family toxin [Bauldia sp.]|nr:type II toxin-antitoxin system RatA family toxin [Bauldia sp.]
MPSFSTTRTVAHPASDMFDLVADVERYPEFVPLCTALAVRSREATPEGELILARMTVAYGPMSESYTSRVRLDRDRLAIATTAIDGPFRKLENNWLFEPLDEDECTVHFALTYELRSFALGLVVGTLFDRAFRRFADAFVKRADALYGKGA